MLQTNYAAIATLFLVYILPIDYKDVGACIPSVWWTRFVYMFFHVNIWHLLSNSYALYFLRPTKTTLGVSYAIAILAPFATFTPAVGASSMVFALWGMRLNAKNDWLIWACTMLISILLPGISWQVHLSSSVMGLGWIRLYRLYHDYRRVSTGK